VSHKPGGRLPLLCARPVVTPKTLKRAATSFVATLCRRMKLASVCVIHSQIKRRKRRRYPQSYAQHHFQFSYSCFTARISTSFTSTQTIDQSCIFTAVQVTKSLQDPLEVGNSLPGISDNVRERGLEQKCLQTLTEG